MLKNRLSLTIFGRFLEGNLTLTTFGRPNFSLTIFGRQFPSKNRPNMVKLSSISILFLASLFFLVGEPVGKLCKRLRRMQCAASFRKFWNFADRPPKRSGREGSFPEPHSKDARFPSLKSDERLRVFRGFTQPFEQKKGDGRNMYLLTVPWSAARSGRSVLRRGRGRACGRRGRSRGRRRPASPAASVSTPRTRRKRSPWW